MGPSKQWSRENRPRKPGGQPGGTPEDAPASQTDPGSPGLNPSHETHYNAYNRRPQKPGVQPHLVRTMPSRRTQTPENGVNDGPPRSTGSLPDCLHSAGTRPQASPCTRGHPTLALHEPAHVGSSSQTRESSTEGLRHNRPSYGNPSPQARTIRGHPPGSRAGTKPPYTRGPP